MRSSGIDLILLPPQLIEVPCAQLLFFGTITECLEIFAQPILITEKRVDR